MTEESKQEVLKQKLEDYLNKRLNSLLEKFQNDINTLESLKYNFYENCLTKLQSDSSTKNSEIKEEPEEKTDEKKEEKIEEKKEEQKEEIKEEETNKEEKKTEKKIEHMKKIEPKKDENSMRSKTPVKIGNINKNKRIKDDKSKDIMNKTITADKKNQKEAKKENKGFKKDLSKDKLDNKGIKSGLSKEIDNNKTLKGSKTKATAGFKRNSMTQTKNEKKHEKNLKKKTENEKKEKEEKQEEKTEEETNEKEEEKNVEEKPKQIEIKPAFIIKLPENIIQNKPISAIFMMLEKKFLPLKQRFNLITSNLNLYKNCYNSNIKFLLEEKLKSIENNLNSIENRFKNYSESDLKTYLTKEFVPSKVAQNSLAFITKEEEKKLTEKTNIPIEIKHIFHVVYYLLDEHFDEKKQASFLIKHLLNEVCSKHNAKDLKNLIINYYNKHKHLNLSPKKFNNIEKVIKENPKILNNKEISKINRPISYLTFYINEAYKYMNLKTKDDVYYYEVRHMNEMLSKYKEDINKLNNLLGIKNEDKKEDEKKNNENEEKKEAENEEKKEVESESKNNESETKNEEEKKED